MLHSYNDLKHYAIRAVDGRKGGVDDFYFDDTSWTLRYLVAHTGFLLSGRQCLIGADLLDRPDPERLEFPVATTTEEIDDAPAPDSDAPVSAQRASRTEQLRGTEWPSLLVGIPGSVYSPLLAGEQLRHESVARTDGGDAGDPHLRSMAEIAGYRVEAHDGEVGTVNDFLIDPEGWALPYFVVDTGTWLPGRQVVLAKGSVTAINAEARTISVAMGKDEIEAAPPLGSLEDLVRSPAQEAIARYGAIGYWPMG